MFPLKQKQKQILHQLHNKTFFLHFQLHYSTLENINI